MGCEKAERRGREREGRRENWRWSAAAQCGATSNLIERRDGNRYPSGRVYHVAFDRDMATLMFLGSQERDHLATLFFLQPVAEGGSGPSGGSYVARLSISSSVVGPRFGYL